MAAHASTLSKPNSMVRTAGGTGTMRTQTWVTTPRVPSLPTTTPRRSRPAASGPSAPMRSSDPSGMTMSSASTCALVTPYARQCGPPAFVLTLPPIDDVCWLDGSGAKVNPARRRWFARSRLGTPGSTHARRSSGRTSTMRVMRAVVTTRASPMGVAPPASPVPLPLGTMARSCATAMRTQACTCSVVVGSATSAQPPSTIEASRA